MGVGVWVGGLAGAGPLGSQSRTALSMRSKFHVCSPYPGQVPFSQTVIWSVFANKCSRTSQGVFSGRMALSIAAAAVTNGAANDVPAPLELATLTSVTSVNCTFKPGTAKSTAHPKLEDFTICLFFSSRSFQIARCFPNGSVAPTVITLLKWRDQKAG